MYNRQKVYEYAKNGHMKEIQNIIIMMQLVEIVQILYHNVYMQEELK